MASTSAVTAAAAAVAKAASATPGPHRRHAAVSLGLPSKLQKQPLLPAKALSFGRQRFTTKAQLNEVTGGSSNDAAPSKMRLEPPASEEKDTVLEKQQSPSAPLSEEAISEFMTQVASLVKLVDSKDIVELQLKQQDCELTIRKKVAPAPVVMMQQPSAPAAIPPLISVPSPAISIPSPASAPQALLPPSASGPKAPPKSSHPPLKSPMAGTLYRSPGPGQPPFVKVGDKVNKGQILCIIEAMKLMNDIEADHAGTVVEILVDDGKPVGIDQPIFVIEP